jgi:hypothetical protein
MDPDARARLDETMTQIAGQTGATLHVYHHPGRAARRVVLAIPVTIAAPSSRPLNSKTTEQCG